MSLFIKFYFTSSMLNMFRTFIHPSSGACDFSIVSPHWLCVLVSMCVGVSVWLVGVVSVWQAQACNTDTTPTKPHRNSNTHRTKNNTTNVIIQQNSRKLLMMDILMSETCWAHNKCNKIASDDKLVFYPSTITMLHGPINIMNVLCHKMLKRFRRSPDGRQGWRWHPRPITSQWT